MRLNIHLSYRLKSIVILQNFRKKKYAILKKVMFILLAKRRKATFTEVVLYSDAHSGTCKGPMIIASG